MNALREFEQRSTRGINDGTFRGFNQAWITFQRFAIPILLNDRRLCPDVPRGQTGCVELIELRLFNADRIGVNRGTFQPTGQRQDHARIDATRKIRADRNIGPEPFFNGLQQKALEFVHERGRILAPFLFALCWKIHLPVGALCDLWPRTGTCRRYPNAMSRREELNTFETSPRTRDC